MLTLEPPYPVIDGYALLPDHTDERLWYALPATPRLALSGDGRPQLSITQYLGGGAGTDKIAGAILQLTTELGIPAEVLADLAEKLPAAVPDLPGGVTVTRCLSTRAQSSWPYWVVRQARPRTGLPRQAGRSRSSSRPVDVPHWAAATRRASKWC